jgi:hypothetical protein
MKAIFVAGLWLILASAHATEKPTKGTEAEREAVRAWAPAHSIPVGKGLTVSDSKGCLWLVWEEANALKSVIARDAHGNCAKISKPK